MKRSILALLVLFLVPLASARATWSIVVFNARTGEVAVGTATCLTNADILRIVPLIRVGVGAAAAQASGDGTGENRALIWEEMQKGTPLEIILELLRTQDSAHETRQYGMVDASGDALTFSGRNTGPFSGGVAGHIGDLHYAIQGNVLTGQAVIDKAEEALISTHGDLAERLMVAMEAAAAMGGDGRCSCRPAQPDDCGAPPPKFEKSAHVGCMVIARLGDTDGDCTNRGCATGEYYLLMNVSRQRSGDPDPVIQLRKRLIEWRRSWEGRPDHLESEAIFSRPALPADGRSQSVLAIQLVDFRGIPVAAGGAEVSVEHSEESTGSSTIGEVIDLGSGRYEVTLTAGMEPGDDELEVRIDDGLGVPVTLAPFPRLHLFPWPPPRKTVPERHRR